MKKLTMDFPQINDYRMTEGLNQLKTNLAFCGKDIKVITIISSVPNEGKSSVTFDLARTLADSGKKILVVDADLRKSVMSSKYHIQGIDKGLSHYLTGQAEIEDIIYETPLGVVIDAVIIGQYSDGAVIVIEQGVIKRKVVQDVIKQLKKGEVRILGAVLNKVAECIGAYGSYEYKYSYSYYGESDTQNKK